MPAERTIMRQVREVLRLKFSGVPIREIARRIGVAASTVRTTIKRFQAAGLSWPLPEEMTDAVLEAKLFADAGTKRDYRRPIEPDWASIHRELKRKHVTLSILWDEYVERNPEGYRYSRFYARALAGLAPFTRCRTSIDLDLALGFRARALSCWSEGLTLPSPGQWKSRRRFPRWCHGCRSPAFRAIETPGRSP
jgi:hypothetical protein